MVLAGVTLARHLRITLLCGVAAPGQSAHALVLGLSLGADRAEFLADVARCLAPLAVDAEEALHLGLAALLLVRVGLLVLAGPVVVLAGHVLIASVGLLRCGFAFLGDWLDRALEYDALVACTLLVVVVLAGSFALDHRLLLCGLLPFPAVVHQEEADLADIAVRELLVRLVLVETAHQFGGVLN